MFAISDTDSTSSSSDEENNCMKLIYQGAGIAAVIYESQRCKAELEHLPGGSTFGRVYLHRDRISANETLKRDYFNENCTYPAEIFCRRFRMNKSVFMRIHDAIIEHDPTNFLKRRDAAKKLGLSGLQKMTAAIRILAYGTAADSVDDYLKVSESSALHSVKAFCSAVINIFFAEYLRNPNNNDIKRILAKNTN